MKHAERAPFVQASVPRCERPACLVCLLKSRATELPDALYVRCDGEEITYSGLWQRAGRMAAALAVRDVQAGSRVGIFSHNSIPMLALLHACYRLGAQSASLNVAAGPQDLEYLVEHLDARIVVFSAELANTHAKTFASLAARGRAVVLDELDAHTTEHEAEHCWSRLEPTWILYSGATTGRPKGIVLPHARALANAERIGRALSPREDDRFHSVLQMSHGWLALGVLTMCLLHRLPCSTTRWFSASRWLQQVRDFDATLVDPFLPMTGAILAQPPSPDDRRHRARLAMGAYGTLAEHSRREAFEQRFGIVTLNVYGQSELGSAVCYELPQDRAPGSSGRPDAGFQFAIATEAGWTTQPHVQGEILVRPNEAGLIALEYLNDAERTVRCWRDLWWHTADLGHFDGEGRLFLDGREAFWIRRKSENVSAFEVEDALRALPGVSDAVVVGVAAEFGDQDIKAYVLGDGSRTSINAPTLHAALAKSIAFFKLPRFIQAVPAIPRTVKGEPDRAALARDELLHPMWDAQQVPPVRGVHA